MAVPSACRYRHRPHLMRSTPSVRPPLGGVAFFFTLLACLARVDARPLGALNRATPLRAGVGRAEISPPVGTPLGGYGERHGKPSTGLHDPLFAKALALDDGS